ncbi:MAG: hypothetical protein ACUZ9M_00790 [Candidatus Scalindua sp.]
MNHIEAASVLDYMKSLWPDWKPEGHLEAVWLKQIKKFDDSVIRQAIGEYKITRDGSYKEPKIYNLLKIANSLQAKVQKDQSENLPEIPGYYIRYVFKDGYEYQKPLYIWRDKRFCTKDTMPLWDLISKEAEMCLEMAQRQSKMFCSNREVQSISIVRGEHFEEEVPF